VNKNSLSGPHAVVVDLKTWNKINFSIDEFFRIVLTKLAIGFFQYNRKICGPQFLRFLALLEEHYNT
jgi:hypothetical protein